MTAPTLSGTQSLTGSFTADVFAGHLATQDAQPAWWLDRKRAAYESFAALALPGRTDETWRFSNIQTIKLEGFELARSVPVADFPAPPDVGPTAASLAFANNSVAAFQPVSAELKNKGVVVSTFSDALRTHGELLRHHFMAQPQKLGSEKFAALHTAFVSDGAFVYIPKGVAITEPIVIAHYVAGAAKAVFPHTLVVAEENSKVTVVDYFAAADTAAHFAVGANDLYAGHGAQLTYVAAQAWSPDTLSFQLNSTVVRRDARVQSLNLHLGARQARHESLSQLQAPGAFSEMLALTIAGQTQEFDQRTLQIHQAANTKSDLLYKNALQDSSKTIFSGLIIVDPDAQKTDAYQSNRNLMLSDDAEANALPGLEIQANDVRCTHGATSSRVDPEQLYYLQSRGIPPKTAHQLLVFGFFEEVLNRLENEQIHLALRRLIETRLKN